MSIEVGTLSGALLSILEGIKKVAKCGLHPLIHTIALKELARNVVGESKGGKV